MRDFKKKQVFRKRLFSKPVLLLLIVILAIVTNGAWDILKKSMRSAQNLELAQEEYQQLVEKQQMIEGRIDRLETETGIEKEIRSKFNVAKEGEQVIVIVDGEQPEIIEEDESEKKTGTFRFFTTMFSWFQ